MRAIDGDALKEVIRSNAYVVDYSETGAIYGMYVDGIKYEIDAQPTIEPERKKGKWKRKIVDSGFNADWVCDKCDYRVKTDYVSFNFCPNCGADMRGKEDE